jgi:hypothetical protein
MKIASKTETLNIRVAPSIKEALRNIAHKEHRTLANTIEFLIVDYYERSGEALDTKQLAIPLVQSGKKI